MVGSVFFHCQYNQPRSKEFRLHRFDLDPKSLSREEPMPMAGPAGVLEGLWRPHRADRASRGVVVVAHPHPLYGGTMQNKVVFHLARVLGHDLDLAALRFNFRGVGASEGHHDEGRGEVEDLLSAWSAAEERAGTGLLVAAGFSFGAAMTLLAATARAQAGARIPDALALAGVPLRLFPARGSRPRIAPARRRSWRAGSVHPTRRRGALARRPLRAHRVPCRARGGPLPGGAPPRGHPVLER